MLPFQIFNLYFLNIFVDGNNVRLEDIYNSLNNMPVKIKPETFEVICFPKFFIKPI